MKDQRSANRRSRSDDSRGLASAPPTTPQSPPAGTHSRGQSSAALRPAPCWARSSSRRQQWPAPPIHSFSALPSTTQAGGHPDIDFEFALSSSPVAVPDPCACDDATNVTVHLPAGFIGNPHATPQCAIADFAADHCPVDSQLGIAEVGIASDVAAGPGIFARSSSPPSTTSSPLPTSPPSSASRAASSTPPPSRSSAPAPDADYGLDVDGHRHRPLLPPRPLRPASPGAFPPPRSTTTSASASASSR